MLMVPYDDPGSDNYSIGGCCWEQETETLMMYNSFNSQSFITHPPVLLSQTDAVNSMEPTLTRLAGSCQIQSKFHVVLRLYLIQRMLSKLSQDVSQGTGKRVYGMPARKENDFNIGWDQQQNLNSYQMKKAKNKQITGKITTQAIIGNQELPPSYQQPPADYPHREHERVFRENSNLTEEQLQKMMVQYDQYRGAVPSRASKAESEVSRRAPIRPRESMKDIIYSGVGVGQEAVRGRGRNNSNHGPSSYNYYQQQQSPYS